MVCSFLQIPPLRSAHILFLACLACAIVCSPLVHGKALHVSSASAPALGSNHGSFQNQAEIGLEEPSFQAALTSAAYSDSSSWHDFMGQITPKKLHFAIADGTGSSISHDTESAVALSFSTIVPAECVVFFRTASNEDGLRPSWRVAGIERQSSPAQAAGVHSHAVLQSIPRDSVFVAVVECKQKPGSRFPGQSDGLPEWAVAHSHILRGRTPPAAGPSGAVRIATLGDMGVRESETVRMRLQRLIRQGSVDLLYHVGDIGYADDYVDLDESEAAALQKISGGKPNEGDDIHTFVWDEWFELMSPILSSVTYMTCPGNHEVSCAGSQGASAPLSPVFDADCLSYDVNFTVYNARFRMPSKETRGVDNMWYSFEAGPVHFAVISTETDFEGSPSGDTMFGGGLVAWLDHDLRSVNRSRTPWIVVTGHRPVYSSLFDGPDGAPQGTSIALQAAIEPLLKRYGVDVFLCGHVHSYERTWPVYNGSVVSTQMHNAKGTVHIINGAGGNTETPTPPPDHQVPQWSANRFSWMPEGKNLTSDMTGWGFGLIDATESSFEWRFFRALDGGVQDRFVLTKDSYTDASDDGM